MPKEFYYLKEKMGQIYYIQNNLLWKFYVVIFFYIFACLILNQTMFIIGKNTILYPFVWPIKTINYSAYDQLDPKISLQKKVLE